MKELAKKLGFPSLRVSQAINKCMRKKFHDVVNGWRKPIGFAPAEFSDQQKTKTVLAKMSGTHQEESGNNMPYEKDFSNFPSSI